MSKIIKINLNLENCDNINLTTEDINYIFIEDISKTIVIGWYGDQIEGLSCKNLEISIKKSKNILRYDFNQEGLGNAYETFERFINGRDIVGVELIYDDGVVKSIGVPLSKSDYVNDYMITEMSNEKDLIIKIKE